MKNYIFISMLMICISLNAQTNDLLKAPEVDSIFSSKLTGEFFYESKQYIGSQFFNKEWTDGDILLSTGEMIHDKFLKYNGLLDELVWLNKYNYGKFKLDKSFVKEFWLKNVNGSNLHFIKINVSDTSKVSGQDIFVEVEVEGKLSLYIQRKITKQWPQDVLVDNVLYRYDFIEATPKYYIKLPSNEYLVMTKLRRLAFLRLFPEKKKAISKIIRENHLNIKIESDFVKVIELMNQEAVF
ncbi:MAG: hypothetical protein WCS79_02310 [Paludibacter sp.]